MTQRIITLLLFTLFFTACVERGYTPKPITNMLTNPIVDKNAQASISPKTIPETSTTHIVKKTENNIILKEKEIVKEQVVMTEKTKIIVKEDNNIFTLTEETKNKISGFFILIIGIIILL